MSARASDILYKVNSPVSNDEMNDLFASAWSVSEAEYPHRDFEPMLERSLAYCCAYSYGRLIGFVNLAWDGGVHAFISEAVVHQDFHRHGIGSSLVREVVEAARQKKIEWVHVDFEPRLQTFYERCGFRSTAAGLMKLR